MAFATWNADEPVMSVNVGGRAYVEVHEIHDGRAREKGITSDRDPLKRLFRVLVADHTDDRPARRGHVLEPPTIVDRLSTWIAVLPVALILQGRNRLSRP